MLTLSAYRAKAILEGVLSLMPGGLRLFRSGTRYSVAAPGAAIRRATATRCGCVAGSWRDDSGGWLKTI